ncbi:hypothetical protein NLJ89_g10840 [Agrocybe chaxingu]|uniref:Uncharacterized protein n=1 Tax=Agrocybe chaxingu TaxID=84603 RepID=A0A9W8MQI8_9AGAR|nr:hypothetical protein NLJ89_g10840 [Agrocybe chaxingu]
MPCVAPAPQESPASLPRATPHIFVPGVNRLNVSTIAPPHPASMKEPVVPSAVGRAQYTVVTIGQAAGIFHTEALARAVINGVEGGHMSTFKNWFGALGFYTSAFFFGHCEVRKGRTGYEQLGPQQHQAQPYPMRPGTSLNPFPVGSAASTPQRPRTTTAAVGALSPLPLLSPIAYDVSDFSSSEDEQSVENTSSEDEQTVANNTTLVVDEQPVENTSSEDERTVQNSTTLVLDADSDTEVPAGHTGPLIILNSIGGQVFMTRYLNKDEALTPVEDGSTLPVADHSALPGEEDCAVPIAVVIEPALLTQPVHASVAGSSLQAHCVTSAPASYHSPHPSTPLDSDAEYPCSGFTAEDLANVDFWVCVVQL